MKSTFRKLFLALALVLSPSIALSCGVGSPISGGQCRVILTSGSSFTVPSDWSLINTEEAIGAGGTGSSATYGNGGAGGCYAKRSNVALTPGSIISYQIGAGGGSTGAGTAPTANTWFQNGSTLVAAGAASTATNCVGDVVYAGGAGGIGHNSGGGGAAGAGGAAGPNGAGNNGTDVTNFIGTPGGSGDAGFGGAGGTQATSGNGHAGSPGSEWTAGATTAGSGGGGGGSYSGGGSSGTIGGAGGLYGGGGSAAWTNPGAGAQGVLVITYTPPKAGFIFIPNIVP